MSALQSADISIVEVAGVEPASEDKTLKTSPYIVCLLLFRRWILEADMILQKLDGDFEFSVLRPIIEPRA